MSSTPSGRRGGLKRGALDSVVVPKGSLDLDEYATSQGSTPSLMFPRPRRGSEPPMPNKMRTVSQNLHKESAAEPTSSDADAGQPGARVYGGEDDAKSLRSTHLAGSPPPSMRNGRKTPNTNRAFSVTSGGTTDGIAQYLYLHEPPSQAARPHVVGSSRSIGGRSGRTITSPHPNGVSAESAHGSVVDDPITTQHQPSNDLLAVPQASSLPRKSSQEALEPLDLSPQHAWYFLRTLVGLEISNEASKLHRLLNFSPETRSTRPRGFGDDEENNYEYGGQMELSAREVPILRYIIKHFLLTLPFIRDVTPASVDFTAGHDSHLDDDPDADMPYYWRAGVLPLLRAFHAADLSEPVDQGRRSLPSILFGIYGAHTMERFVAGGLRLTGTSYEDPMAAAGAALAASDGVAPSASARAENPFNRSLAASPSSQRSGAKGFSGLFKRAPSRNSVDTPDLAGPRPDGQMEPMVNELTSDVDSDDEAPLDKSVAGERRRAEEALAGGAVAGAAAESVAAPKTPPRKSTSDETARDAFIAETDRRRSDAETSETGDMQTAENGEEGNTTGRISAVTAFEGLSTPAAQRGNDISHDLTPTEEAPKAQGGILSSVVGYFTGGTPDAQATSMPKKDAVPGGLVSDDETSTVDGVHATDAEEGDRTLRAPEDDDAVSEETAAPRRAHVGEQDIGHHAFSTDAERKNAGKPVKDSEGYEVPDTAGLMWDGKRSSAPGSPRKSPGSPSRTRRELEEPEDTRKDFSPAKRPPRSSSKAVGVNDRDNKKKQREIDAKRRKDELAAVVATGVQSPKGDQSSKKRGFSLSSFSSSMKRSKSTPQVKQSNGPLAPLPSPAGRQADGKDWYAPLNLPVSLSRSTPSRVPIEPTPMQNPVAINDYSPNSDIYGPTAGHAWPWGAPVPFWKGTPVHRVAWGGFEADVVGVRKAFTGHAFIIRVRRPQRLDEYVLRDESQFRKYLGVLERQYPHAHLRAVPEGKISAYDDAIDHQALAQALQKKVANKRKTRSFIRPLSTSGRSTSGRDTGVETEPEPETGVSDDEGRRSRSEDGRRQSSTSQRKSMSQKPSRLSMRLKEAASFYGEDRPSSRLSKSAPASRRGTVSGPPPMPSGGRLPPRLAISADPNAPTPYLDAQRRALRNWLRDTLSVRTVGHNKETAAFLLLGGVRLREPEQRDVAQREYVDDSRRRERIGVAQGAADRARVSYNVWHSVMQEVIQGDGLLAISEAVRTHPQFDNLPSRLRNAAEWSRLCTAQAVHDLFVAGEHSGPLFLKLKRLNAAVPWFLLRQAFKLPNAGLMVKGLQDLLLTGRFGKQSLLNKALIAILDDDPATLNDQIEACKARIQSTGMCEKINRFVYASRETKDMVRKHAAEHNMELVVTIVRGADEPRLDRYDLERVVRAAKIYKSFMKRNPTPAAKVKTENGSVRLILDLQIYLRLLSRERDAQQIRNILADEATADAFRVLLAPFMEFLKRAYRVADMSRVISDLQKFLDQLIVIIDALRARIQDPQKAVRIISRLFARHSQPFYTLLHTLHRDDTAIEEIFQWLWTATTFLRRGLAKQVDLAAIVPNDSDDRRFLLEEIDAIVEFHKRKRQRQYELMCRRYAGDIDGDDPVIVEGDGWGKSKIEPLVENEPRVPRLFEIPRLTDAFRSVLVNVFSV